MKAGKGLHMLLMRFLNKEFLKFIITGLINTLISYLVYFILLNITTYYISYFVSYFIGIVVSYLINTWFVFREKVSMKKMFKFPVVYLVQFLINSLGLILFVDKLNMNEKIAPVLIIILTIPITYLISKKIIGNR